MGRVGQCWDNALAESFFASLKNELIYRTVFPTKTEPAGPLPNTSKSSTIGPASIPAWATIPRQPSPLNTAKISPKPHNTSNATVGIGDRARARRTLHTGAGLLTDKQQQRLDALFTADEHIQVEATWGIYQAMIGAYREPDRAHGRQLMQQLIDRLRSGVPDALTEIITLGRILNRRAGDILAYFDRPGTSKRADRGH